MATFDAQAVAQLLREFAAALSLRGGNPYRAKAYARAADSLPRLPCRWTRLVAAERLHGDSGCGSRHRRYHHQTPPNRHASQALEAMRKEIPGEVSCGMFAVPGLRPGQGAEALQRASASRRSPILKRPPARIASRAVKGLGPALQTKILQNIEIGAQRRRPLHLHRAAHAAGKCRSAACARPTRS